MKESFYSAGLAEKIWMAMVVTLPLVFSLQVYEGALLPKLLVFQSLLLLVVFLALYSGTWSSVPNALYLAIACYLFLLTLSVTQATNITEAALTLSHHIGFGFVPLLLSTLSIVHLNRICAVAAWASLPIAGIGLTQYLGLGFDWIPSNAQPSATFYHRNAAAAYLICTIPLVWIGLQCSKNKTGTIAWTVLLMCQATCLIFTRTRAAWVALVGASIALYLLYRYLGVKIHAPTYKSRLLMLSICIVVLSAFLPENIQGTRKQKFDEKKSDAATAVTSMFTPEGSRGRFALWQHTLSMIADNPLGVGLGNWQFVYPLYAKGEHINVTAAPERPHNDLLWIAAELGIAGLFAFLAIVINAAKLAKSLLRHTDQNIHILTLGLSGIVIVYLIDGLFSFPRGQIVPTFFFWFALGGIALLYIKTQNSVAKTVRLPWIIGVFIVITTLIITTKRIAYDIYHLQVHTAERRQDWPTVIQNATDASAIGTYRANTFIALGRALYRSGDMQAAHQAYTTGLLLHPNSLNAHNNLGIVQRRLGNPEKAIASFETAIALYPNFVEAHYNLGLAYFDLGHYEKALAKYQKAIDTGLNAPQVYYSIARVHHQQGNLILAQQHYLQALRQNPHYAPAQRALEQLGVFPSTQ